MTTTTPDGQPVVWVPPAEAPPAKRRPSLNMNIPRDRIADFRERLKSPDAALLTASSVLLPLGLLLILLGWRGASRTPFLFEQVPYLISGGLLGVSLVFGAGLCYFGGWIARSATQQRDASKELAGLLREVRDELAARPVSNGDAPTSVRRRRAAAPARPVGQLVATGNGSMVHRPDCQVVATRDDVRQVDSTGEGLRACRLCNPLENAQATPLEHTNRSTR